VVKSILFYLGLALIPILIFALLLHAARVSPPTNSKTSTASRRI
jgi:hypothetical protein